MRLAVALAGVVLGVPALGASLPGLLPAEVAVPVPGVQAGADPLALARDVLAAESWTQTVLAIPDLQCSGLREQGHEETRPVADVVGSIYARAGLAYGDADRVETGARAAALPDYVEQALQQLLGASDSYFAE